MNIFSKEKALSTLKQHGKTWFWLLFATLAITAVVFLITSNHLYLLALNMLDFPTLLLLNILPVFLCILLVYFLTNKPIFSICLSGAIFLLLAIVAKVKVTMRQEPLLPSDFTLVKEALTIVKTFPVSQLILIGLLFLAILFAIGLSFRLTKSSGLSPLVRICGCVLILLLGFGANHTWYKSEELYETYPVIDNPYFEVNQYHSKGLIYSFLHQYNIAKVTAPDGYNKAYFASLPTTPSISEDAKTPNIIMIMGEAFSDLSENENLDFSNYTDPLETFKEMGDSENGIRGKIVVANYGGGTSNTEYDVLTGLATRYLNSTLPSYNFIRKNTDSLPSRLAQIGYDTVAIHPGYEWFYNRQNVYPYLGFETTYFLEDSFDLSTQGIGGYINETATMDKIIETLDTHIKESDAPLFSFTVTIQNHGPYENRFGAQAQNFDTDIDLTETESDLLTQYFKGITDADQQLARLKEYAQASDEPIVIVYFGDHLPGFSNGMDFFDILDYPIDANGTLEERLRLYETPYLIWQNDSAKEDFSIVDNATMADLPENDVINSYYLSPLLTELLNLEGLSPLFDYSNSLRRSLPVSNRNLHVDIYGNYYATLPDEYEAAIHTITSWQYFTLFE